MKTSYQQLELSERLISDYRSNELSDPSIEVPADWEKDARALLAEVFGAEEDWASFKHPIRLQIRANRG